MTARHGTLTFGICIVTICALALAGMNAARAQNPAPGGLVGTWNFKGTLEINPPVPYIFVMTFNEGGTTVEFDSSATGNPSASETISLGTWRQTGAATYTFKEENYTYDASGNLSGIAIATSNLTIDSDADSVTGTGSVSFYGCTVSQCPGPLVQGPFPESITGNRI
jgi:hypothetical protein